MTRIAKEGCANGLTWEESLEVDTPTLNICRPRGDRFIATVAVTSFCSPKFFSLLRPYVFIFVTCHLVAK